MLQKNSWLKGSDPPHHIRCWIYKIMQETGYRRQHLQIQHIQKTSLTQYNTYRRQHLKNTALTGVYTLYMSRKSVPQTEPCGPLLLFIYCSIVLCVPSKRVNGTLYLHRCLTAWKLVLAVNLSEVWFSFDDKKSVVAQKAIIANMIRFAWHRTKHSHYTLCIF